MKSSYQAHPGLLNCQMRSSHLMMMMKRVTFLCPNCVKDIHNGATRTISTHLLFKKSMKILKKYYPLFKNRLNILANILMTPSLKSSRWGLTLLRARPHHIRRGTVTVQRHDAAGVTRHGAAPQHGDANGAPSRAPIQSIFRCWCARTSLFGYGSRKNYSLVIAKTTNEKETETEEILGKSVYLYNEPRRSSFQKEICSAKIKWEREIFWIF